jgi:hypothetical protein
MLIFNYLIFLYYDHFNFLYNYIFIFLIILIIIVRYIFIREMECCSFIIKRFFFSCLLLPYLRTRSFSSVIWNLRECRSFILLFIDR